MALASQRFLRHIADLSKRSALVCAAAVALTPALTPLPASAAVSGNEPALGTKASVEARATDSTAKCTPQAGQAVTKDDGDDDTGDNDDNQNEDNDDNQCPPPVVPEAPAAILLPLSAGAVISVAYFLGRRRQEGLTD